MSVKSAICGEYLLTQEESGSIKVLRHYDNVKASLRLISEKIGFDFDEKWTTRQFGTNLLKQQGCTDEAYIGEFGIKKHQNGSIETYRTYDNTKGALREIAEKIGFDYDEKWTTRQFGTKLIKHLHEN